PNLPSSGSAGGQLTGFPTNQARTPNRDKRGKFQKDGGYAAFAKANASSPFHSHTNPPFVAGAFCMESPPPTRPPCPSRVPHSIWSSDVAILTYIAVATIVVHLFTGERYGFHRDELATLEDARHLAWGFVAYPPITPFFGRLSLILFGTSLAGFRFF